MITSVRRGFTLVEILVVIAIIGVLVALISVAAVSALKKAQATRIKHEINELAAAFEEYHARIQAYPPNGQIIMPIDPNYRRREFRQFLKKIFPRCRENEALMDSLVGFEVPTEYKEELYSGISAGEALVFWLTRFSDDPGYPISGEGGPSYLASLGNQEPLEKRRWLYPFDLRRLVPRDSNGHFKEVRRRYIEFPDPRFPDDRSKRRRINFWQYAPEKSQVPYLYFDVSRDTPNLNSDVASGIVDGIVPMDMAWIYPLKRVARKEPNGDPLFRFANQGKFQILHCGLDDVWGERITQLFRYEPKGRFPGPEFMNLMRLDIDADRVVTSAEKQAMMVFPDGPYPPDFADTVVNFTTATRIDEAQSQ